MTSTITPLRIVRTPTTQVDAALVRLLSNHFGDRSLYLLGDEDQALLPRAVALGLVSEEGYLTGRGYQVWQHAQAA